MAGAPEVPGEFETIARLFRPLTDGSAEALDLLDDVAVVGPRPGEELVLTTDAMVAGVHFLPDEPLDLVARKLLRANLSDLAAKGATPHGYLLTVAWPHGTAFEAKAAFAGGLQEDQARFGVRLLGGDTVSTPGPLTAGLTLLGWTQGGRLVRRSGARAGDRLLVTGTIGDAGLGLQVLKGDLRGVGGEAQAFLLERHRLPTPRLEVRPDLLTFAQAAADVSDGLVADAGHLAEASGLRLEVALDRLPLSPAAEGWLEAQPSKVEAATELATSGDDYEVVCAAAPDKAAAFIAAAGARRLRLTDIGEFTAGTGVHVAWRGRELALRRTGWSHG